MRRVGFLAALGLILLANAWVLGGVAWNRAAAPEATLRLSERELPLQGGYSVHREDTGVALRLAIGRYDAALDWLDEAKLRALGFRPGEHVSDATTGGRGAVRQPLPRPAFVVLEFDGPAWQAELARREAELAALATRFKAPEAETEVANARQALQDFRQGQSRLVPVDAGIDPAVLRQRYPDRTRYAIVAAKIRMWLSRTAVDADAAETAATEIRGDIAQVLVDAIHVPRQYHAALAAALGDELTDAASRHRYPAHPPRYEVALHYGRRLEPWIDEITVRD